MERPGVYELPLGVTLTSCCERPAGSTGTLQGVLARRRVERLPARLGERDVPLDFKSLAAAGSMLGSAGVVVLNDTVDMAEAALAQAVFFEDESCGQCSPCRIGTRMRAPGRSSASSPTAATRRSWPTSPEVAWGMTEGSICGLGQAASLPLTTRA